MTGTHRAVDPARGGARRSTGPRHHWIDRDWVEENYLWFVWPLVIVLVAFAVGFLLLFVINGDFSDPSPEFDLPNQPTPNRSHP